MKRDGMKGCGSAQCPERAFCGCGVTCDFGAPTLKGPEAALGLRDFPWRQMFVQGLQT